MFGAKRSRIKKQFKKDFGFDLTDEDADKVINWARSRKFEQIDDFIQTKINENRGYMLKTILSATAVFLLICFLFIIAHREIYFKRREPYKLKKCK